MASDSDSLHRAISALQRLSDLFVQRREVLAREAGLTVPQWRLLEEISTEHFMPSMFAQRRSVSAAAVSKLVRSLLDRQLVSVAVGKDDRRLRKYTLTAKGKRSLDGLRDARKRAIEEVWGDIPPTELERFSRFGEELSERLEAYVDA